MRVLCQKQVSRVWISTDIPHYFVWGDHLSMPLIPASCSPVLHYSDVIMSVMASQIIGVSIVHSTVSSGADQRKLQSSASLAFVRGICRWPVNSPHKGLVTRKMFPFDDVIMSFISDHVWGRLVMVSVSALLVFYAYSLTHQGRDKMAVVSQTTFSNTFSWIKMYEFRLRFHWSLFPKIWLTIFIVQIMAWRRPGDRPLSAQMMVGHSALLSFFFQNSQRPSGVIWGCKNCQQWYWSCLVACLELVLTCCQFNKLRRCFFYENMLIFIQKYIWKYRLWYVGHFVLDHNVFYVSHRNAFLCISLHVMA